MRKKTQKQIKADKRRAGSAGGAATVQNHPETNERGKNAHMSRIGRLGAAETWRRYHLAPYGLTQYVMVSRATNKVIKVIGRAPRMESILGE